MDDETQERDDARVEGRPVERGTVEQPETAREPAPGVVHEPEPDGGNVMPVRDEPGTL